MNLAKTNYIFVYGTLRRDLKESKYNLISKYTRYIGFGFVYGKLYEVNRYPGIVLQKNRRGKVFGELYYIKRGFLKRVLKILDDYEECSNKFKKPYEYRRVRTVAYVAKKKLKVWIYEYNYDISNLKQVESGDYSKSSLASK